nr:hypothetical protein [Nostoc sp. DedQUE02]
CILCRHQQCLTNRSVFSTVMRKSPLLRMENCCCCSRITVFGITGFLGSGWEERKIRELIDKNDTESRTIRLG